MSAAEEHAGRTSFVMSKLGSGLALLPLGVWTVIHVWDNLAVFEGGEAWQSAVTGYKHPASQIVTTLIVLGPLLIHTIWGIARLRSSRPNYPRYGYFGNLTYLLQRLSAAGVLLFIGAHLWLAFLRPRIVEMRPEPFVEIAREMRHHLPTLLVYVLGTLGVAYHLANGLYGFSFGWGLATSQRALRRVRVVSVITFVILLAMSWGAIYGLWLAGA